MIHRRARVGLLAAALAAGVIVPGATGPGAAVAAPGAGPAGPTVTLLTGDRVTLGGMYGVRVRAAKGREHITFHTREDERGDTHVVPEDAASLVSRGKLDPRLFDVTLLVRAGYDDASRSTLPVIVDYPGATPRVAGARVSRELPTMSAAAVSVERTADFWSTAREADHVWLDGPVRASLDRSVPQIGAPEAWAAGHTGAGATVAVLDTGIDVTHPDLADAVVGERNFTDSGTTDDRDGHGTHVASTIAGNGAKYQGVAPDAKLLNGKVLNDFGGGMESWIIAGMEWAANSGADVVNMSLGDWLPSDGTDSMSQALNRISAETGALFVVAAGNSGGLVGSPAAADAALTVGAVDRDDQLADFSSRGRKDDAIKPEITAPGVDIVAAKAANGTIGDPVEDGYVRLSGTSMATPHVAGAAAIVAAQHPEWTAEQLKAALMGSAKPNGELSVFEEGAGRVDVARATAATVFASAGSLGFGTVRWPHDDDTPVAKTVTYTNTGTSPVTLDLALDVTGPSAVPHGMFTVSPAQVTVPAGGRASATVTTDTRIDSADGVYSGVLTATGGGQSVRTPLVVTREVESYDVTMKFIDHNGSPTDEYSFRFVDVDIQKAYWSMEPASTIVMRLPKGEFYFEGGVYTLVGGRYKSTDFTEPAFMVTHDTELVLDARQGKRIGFTVDEPNAKIGTGVYRFYRKTAWGETGANTFVDNYDYNLVKPATTVKKDDFTFSAEARMAEWNGTSFEGSPYTYNVRHTENGTVPRTVRWTFHDRQLATVRSEHASTVPGMIGFRDSFLPLQLPATLTEYYTPDVPWDGSFQEVPEPWGYPAVSDLYQGAPRSFPLGRTTTERWNAGVFGPAFPKIPDTAGQLATRSGDTLDIALSLAADQGRGRIGWTTGTGSTTLLRDGQVVEDNPYPGAGRFEVGPDRARYTLRTNVDRSSVNRLSTQISAEWTFTSEHTTAAEPLPLLAVRFTPNLDNDNAAPAGKRFTIPMFVERNGSDETGRLDTPAVEVSYDDGATWQPAKVGRDHGQWRATVDHPAAAEFVSLRSTVADRDGNAQRLTVIRAYALT